MKEDCGQKVVCADAPGCMKHWAERVRDLMDERDWLLSKIEGVGVLIGKNGCDCECDHDAESHDETCERCLACRISETLWPPLGSRR